MERCPLCGESMRLNYLKETRREGPFAEEFEDSKHILIRKHGKEWIFNKETGETIILQPTDPHSQFMRLRRR